MLTEANCQQARTRRTTVIVRTSASFERARMRTFFEEYEVDEQFDEDEMVQRLRELKESLREHYRVGRTLNERLEDAIASEQYELAAQLRDEIAKRRR